MGREKWDHESNIFSFDCLIAFFAVQFRPHKLIPSFRCGDPFADLPRGIVAKVTGVTASQISDPIRFLILMKRDDFSFH